MKLLQPISESMVRELASKAEPESAFAKVLEEAEEIKSRGSKVRFWITDAPGICCQEGVEFISTQPQ